jgi:hypothetical protein
MNNSIKYFYLFGLLSVSLITQAQVVAKDEAAIKQRVVRFFDGIAKLDEPVIRDEVTNDFQLLEDGLVWNADSLMVALRKVNSASFSRINSIDFISVTQRDDVAWVSYWNHADVSMGDRKFKLKWLESAILIKSDNRWRISVLHATKIRP